MDASFGRNFPSLGLPPQPDDRTSRSDTATGGRAFLEGELPPTVNQIIIVRVSTSNDCRYSRLTDALEAQGVPAEVIDTLTVDANPTNLPPVGRVVVELAGKSGANPRSISDEGFKSLRGYGLSIGES